MTEYVKFTEHNEWEGETWHFWIPVEGNEDAIGQLVNVVSDMDTETYETSLRRRTEQEVDLLVEEVTGTMYMAAHNKLSGKLVLPPRATLLDLEQDPLYKGGIRDFMR